MAVGDLDFYYTLYLYGVYWKQIKGALDKYHIIPNFFQKKSEFLYH